MIQLCDLHTTAFNIGSGHAPNYSGVKVLHIPTGTIVICGRFNAAHKNKAVCIKQLAEDIKNKPVKKSFTVRQVRKLLEQM